jgi:hypothetical protein
MAAQNSTRGTATMAMARTMKGRNAGFGPFGGEYYDYLEENETLGVAALWSGKTVETEYSNSQGVTRLVFGDGSVADLHDRTVVNAGPGNLALIGPGDDIIAK